MQLRTKLRLRRIAVWLCRFIVGAAFIISGWAKSIDPRGFIIKVNEYLSAWDFSLPVEVVFTACVALSCVEFIVGLLLFTGSLKRSSAIIATAIMAFMLPLTLYIAIKNPVSDCGCFGDFIVLSNWATFFKNVAIVAMSVYLLKVNHTIKGIFAPPVQWLTIIVSVVFVLYIVLVGYNVQPLVDFRPYKLGTVLFDEDAMSQETIEYYIYEKNGHRERFTLSDMPDTTWTFIDVVEDGGVGPIAGFDVHDSDGYDVTEELSTMYGAVLYLIVPNPDVQFLSRAHYVNRLYEYARAHGVKMIGIAGTDGTTLEKWTELTRPQFEVFSAEDTALKQLVRGDAALVYTYDGAIKWKRTLSSMKSTLPEDTTPGNALDGVRPVDDGKIHTLVVCLYLFSLAIIYMLSLSPKILSFFVRLAKKNN
ncbi:MAG: DoxX family protein [Muribaculaceae bacterium]|nr:DoxX family protein [Muribaculaceae bacterium]